MTTKKINPRTASKQAEHDIMATRLDKLNKLVAAKEAHDKAVQQAQDDELADYGKQLDAFSKRAPALIQMATQVAKLAAIPTVTMRRYCMSETEYVFGATTYPTSNGKPQMYIGATRQREGYGSTSAIVIGPDGQWASNKYDVRGVCFEKLENKTAENRWRPNAKDFMLAALEWEKQLYALVDSL